MPNRYVSLHIGGTGVRVGNRLLDILCHEHNIGFDGFASPKEEGIVTTFFDELSNGKFRYRGIFADYDTNILNDLKNSQLGELIMDLETRSQMVHIDGSLNFASMGGSSSSSKSLDEYYISIENQLRFCYDHVTPCRIGGLMCYSNLKGGLGSGGQSRLISHFTDVYPKQTSFSISVFQDPHNPCDGCDCLYNSILSLGDIAQCDLCFVLNNHSLMKVAQQITQRTQVSYKDINSVHAILSSQLTSTARFDTSEGNLGAMMTNCVPYPGLFTVMPSISLGSSFKRRNAVNVAKDLFQPHIASLCQFETPADEFDEALCARILYRDERDDSFNVYQFLSDYKEKDGNFVNYIPCPINFVRCHTKNLWSPLAKAFEPTTMLLLQKNTKMRHYLRSLLDQYNQIHRIGAFLHHFEKAGVTGAQMLHEKETVEIWCTALDKINAMYGHHRNTDTGSNL